MEPGAFHDLHTRLKTELYGKGRVDVLSMSVVAESTSNLDMNAGWGGLAGLRGVGGVGVVGVVGEGGGVTNVTSQQERGSNVSASGHLPAADAVAAAAPFAAAATQPEAGVRPTSMSGMGGAMRCICTHWSLDCWCVWYDAVYFITPNVPIHTSIN